MAYSMTGYGRAERTWEDCRLLIEIKSVNNRYGDVQMRGPRTLMFMESKIKDRVLQRLVRGKIDLFITLEDKRADGVDAEVNEPLALAYSQAFTRVAALTGRDDRATAETIARFPDVVIPRSSQWSEEVLEEYVLSVLEETLDGISNMRGIEGARLTEDLIQKIDGLRGLRLSVLERAPLVPEEYKTRLAERMQELVASIPGVIFDEGRKEMELSVFADKCCIDEELVRLESHLTQLVSVLESEGSIGKKLDFLLQEVNREVNTIGSKGNDLAISGLVVEMKSELEKIREQIQNLV